MRRQWSKHTLTRVFPGHALTGNQGAALIPIIIAIVIISTIGAVLLSLSSVGTFNSLLGNSADSAYYLAESGFRYAAMKYKHGGEGELNQINNLDQPFTVGSNQEFTLRFRSYKFKVTGTDEDGDTLYAEAPFGWVPEFPANNAGYVKIGGSSPVSFDSVNTDNDGPSMNIVKSSGTWDASTGEPVRFVALSDDSDISDGNLRLNSDTNAIAFFPKYNGRFSVNGEIYQYKTRSPADVSNPELRGITPVGDSPDLNALELAVGDEIILNDFVAIHSTGTYGQGFFGANRHLIYHVPFSIATGGGDFYDPFNNDNNWGDSIRGTHDVQELEGRLAVTGTTPVFPWSGDARTSLIPLQWEPSAGDFTSYDAQTKIMVQDISNYMAGISFRMIENGSYSGSYYGLSFLNTSDSDDGIPDSIVPQNNTPLVVLWENIRLWGLPFRRWLAYYELPQYNYITSNIFFEDDVEDAREIEYSKWKSEEDWEITDSEYQSEGHSWHNLHPANTKPDNILISNTFNLSNTTDPQLHFWHSYSISGAGGGPGGGSSNASAKVQISNDNGANWETLEKYQGDSEGWTHQIIDLSEEWQTNGVMIRFNIGGQGNSKWSGDWYIDDVYVFEEEFDWPTLMVSVKEGVSISFDNGRRLISDGDTITDADEDVTGIVYGDPVLSGGSWSSTDAAGDLLLRNVSGDIQDFDNNENLLVNEEVCATVESINDRQNYIRAYIGDQNAHEPSNYNPLDRNRLANPRGEVNWPPRDPDYTNPDNDYFTLVQWDEVNGPTALMGTGNEQDAVIRTDISPAGTMPENTPKLGLHTWGDNVANHIFFDDFAIRLEDGETRGFAPAIQESQTGE